MQTDKILKELKDKGFKATRVREALIEILVGNNTPLDIVELLEKLRNKDLTPNKTTVYRELTFLKEQALLQEVEFGDGKSRFEISRIHHHHAICINCQRIYDIPMEKDLQKKETEIMKDLGFKSIGHSLEFFGLCKDCQKKEQV